MEPYLDETAYHDTPNCTFPFGTHIAIVEVDQETGVVDLVRYVAVDDVGKKINPLIVDGQLHGGIAQGIGQALWEEAVYADDGQLLSGSLMDYALPRASWLPAFELDETVTPSPVNPLGVKGVGEAGCIASTAAVANAVIDALSPLGIRHLDMPYTAQKVWGAIQSREGRPGMIPAPFGYTRAGSVEEALDALAADDGAKVIAGGQSLLPLMKLRLAQPGVARGHRRGSSELKGVTTLADGRLAVGSLTTYAELVRLAGEPLRDDAGRAADDRRRPGAQPGHGRRLRGPRGPGVGPAGGAAVARRGGRAPVVARRADRARWTASSRARSRPASRADELLISVILPAPLPGAAGSAYESLEQKASGYSLVGVSAVVIRPPGGPIQWAGIGVTGVSEAPYRAKEVEDALVGTDGSADVVAAAAAKVVGGRPVNSDIHAGSDYRAAMAVGDHPPGHRVGDRADRLSPPPRPSTNRNPRVRLERIVPGRTPAGGPGRRHPDPRPVGRGSARVQGHPPDARAPRRDRRRARRAGRRRC